jgi:hypothetical protein
MLFDKRFWTGNRMFETNWWKIHFWFWKSNLVAKTGSCEIELHTVYTPHTELCPRVKKTEELFMVRDLTRGFICLHTAIGRVLKRPV